ncbi:MAG: hypothetical protein R2814_11310 [Flavobacteriaceae bacterium]
MYRKLTGKQRFNSGLVLIVAFLLVFTFKELSRRNLTTVHNSVNSMFEDRVLALGYIYRLNNLFHLKELELASGKVNVHHDEDGIKELLAHFSRTKLTSKESAYFELLKENYTELLSLKDNGAMGTQPTKELDALFGKIHDNLDKLSKEQLSEGRELTHLSNRTLNMNQLLSVLEIALLIVVGLLILFLNFPRENRL